MSKRTAKSPKNRPAKAKPAAAPAPAPPDPVDVADGIPDRAASPTRRRLLWVVLIFVAWMAFMAYVKIAGS